MLSHGMPSLSPVEALASRILRLPAHRPGRARQIWAPVTMQCPRVSAPVRLRADCVVTAQQPQDAPFGQDQLDIT
jgi:hypothetical protein